MRATATGNRSRRWIWFLLPATLSLLTMSVTAIWFLALSFLILVGAALWTGVRAKFHRPRSPGVAESLGLGLLVGPLVYLALALLS